MMGVPLVQGLCTCVTLPPKYTVWAVSERRVAWLLWGFDLPDRAEER